MFGELGGSGWRAGRPDFATRLASAAQQVASNQ
jgi:hypothetical protein